MEKIKVVISLNDLNMGGAQRLAVDQLKLLDRNIFELYLITLIQDDEKIDFYNEIPSDIKVFKLNFKNIRDIKEWFKLYRILKSIKPNIVKSALIFSNTIFGILKIFVGYKLITAEHNTKINKTKSQIFSNKVLDRLAYTKVVDSELVAKFLSESEGINIKRFTVIYNGVYLDDVDDAIKEYSPQREDIRKEYDIDKDAKVFLSVARMVNQKNHELMINSFKLVCNEVSNSYLILIGDGPLRNKIENQIKKLGLEDKVLILGERKDIYKFYAISDCYLVTSRHEGFCIVAMNGLAFGIPVISTKVAGIMEYLKEGYNGYFTENTPEDVSKKIITFLNSKESMELSCRETTLDFSVDIYKKRNEEILLKCYKD